MLKEFKAEMHVTKIDGLNPYFNGTCSKRTGKTSKQRVTTNRLNPYFNGTCSKRLRYVE